MNPLARLELERAKEPWHELEVAALVRHWPDVRAIEQETGRSYAAIKAKGARLGLMLSGPVRYGTEQQAAKGAAR